MASTQHNTHSSYRENLLEHIFVAEVLRYLWTSKLGYLEVLKPQVDDAGYDLVFEYKSIIRHVQLKTSKAKAATASVNVNVMLEDKPSACVIWSRFNPDTLELGPFYWLGGLPHSKICSLQHLKVAKHTKGDATGKKAERPMIRVIPKSKFEKLNSIPDVVHRLFGIQASP